MLEIQAVNAGGPAGFMLAILSADDTNVDGVASCTFSVAFSFSARLFFKCICTHFLSYTKIGNTYTHTHTHAHAHQQKSTRKSVACNMNSLYPENLLYIIMFHIALSCIVTHTTTQIDSDVRRCRYLEDALISLQILLSFFV